MKNLTKELLDMARVDQKIRQGGNFDKDIDIKNYSRLKKIVDEIGWPTKSKVGDEASHAAWLLVQHADSDPDFQRKCLGLMKTAGDKDVEKNDIAYLEDRVRVNTEQPQLYGTQFYRDKNGELVPRNIEDETNLDKRREQAGLSSFDEYKKKIKLAQSN